MNMEENSIVIISFSGRKNGNCERIARHIQSLTGGRIYSFAELNVHPCGQCSGECFANGSDCPHIGDDLPALYEAVMRCDLAFYILPNHCDYPNANFFAFNERSLCVFSKQPELLEAYGCIPKKFIVISGGEEENFRAALSQHAENPDILFLRAKDYGKKSIAGDLMTAPDAVAKVESFIQNEDPIE